MTNLAPRRGWNWPIRLGQANGTLALVVMIAQVIVATQSAQAQTYKVLYSFTGGADGRTPIAGLVGDAAGNLYGTTVDGGDPTCDLNPGCGTVFKLDTSGTETVLHTFTWADGTHPVAALVRDASGNLYGTTIWGGDSTCYVPYGCGTVFKVDTTGKYTVLHTFTGGADGVGPEADLIRDAAGNLYGTTYQGGASDRGTVFKLDTSGAERVRHIPGAHPAGALVRDAAGSVYGTTVYGGTSNVGTVFKLDTSGTGTVLHTFTGGVDGAYPYEGLVRDAAGNLYGIAYNGGDLTCNVPFGCGTVFEVDTTGKYTVLHTFTGGADGAHPWAALVRDAAGSLYGLTVTGGPSDAGTVFKLDTTGKETVLYSFSGGTDGGNPYGSLVRDAERNLYGTTAHGGITGGACRDGCGVVFKLTP